MSKRMVYLVDDDAAVRSALGGLLAVCGFAVREFASGRALLDALGSLADGCILLDLRMPDLSGLAVQGELVRLGVTLPVIFLTGHGDVPTGVAAMKGGASDFLLKPVHETALLEALAQGFARLDRTVGERAASRDARSRIASLTPREREVIALVIEGLRNRAIAARLRISLQTVKVHRMRAMAKLGADDMVQLTRIWREAQGAS